jgi:hypothetical protein
MAPHLHQVNDRAPIAGGLEDPIGQDRNRFRVVELQATGLASASNVGCHVDQQSLLFMW